MKRSSRWPRYRTGPKAADFAPMHYLIVFVGGGIGAALRRGVNRAALA